MEQKDEKRKQESVTTCASKVKDVNVNTSVSKNLKKDISVKRYKLVILLVCVCVVGIFLGGFWGHQISRDIFLQESEKNAEFNRHVNVKMYKRDLDYQLKIISYLKKYKKYMVENNKGIKSTSEIDGLINTCINDFKYNAGYDDRVMPEFDYNHTSDSEFEKKFESYLSKLEELVEILSYSFGVNSSIKQELSTRGELIKENVEDMELLNRAWKLEAICADNLQRLEDDLS